MPESIASYIGAQPARLEFKGAITQEPLPVVDRQGGKGITTHESIAAGARFTLRLSVPTRGFMPVKEFAKFLYDYAPAPVRGLSQARGCKRGACTMVGFRDLGPIRGSAQIDFSGLPDESLKFAAAFFGDGKKG